MDRNAIVPQRRQATASAYTRRKSPPEEARRLMLSENLDAGEAGYRVGYEDQSHFSRDYERHFGEPTVRDVERLRELATA